MDLHQRLIALSDLDCAVARRFQDRPVLTEVAGRLLAEQWRQRRLGDSHDPLSLYLISRSPPGARAWIRPLSTLLIERFCRRVTLNLTEGEDFISTHAEDNPDWAVAIDLHAVELLINDCGPFMLDRYREELLAYWSRFDITGQTPWQWYTEHLRQQFINALDAGKRASRLRPQVIDLANRLLVIPETAVTPTASPSVSLLSSDLSASGKIDRDLGSALLIEHSSDTAGTSVTLLFTLVGKLLVFPSRQVMINILERLWPATPTPAPHVLRILPQTEEPFAAQALGLLRQQLDVVQAVANNYHAQGLALALGRNTDHLTSMVELCNRAERTQRQRLTEQLPDWLRHAPYTAQALYARNLVDVAQSYEDANGQFWLDGIVSAEAFANQQLRARLAVDHPGESLAPEEVLVLNYQITTSSTAIGDTAFTSGEIHTVTFSLAELAIGNLVLLKPGKVALASSTGQPLPAWLNEGYVKTLVSELDIGASYPRLLRTKLLDDPEQRHARERLLDAQLRSQLPAQAMELHLRGEGISEASALRIAQIFTRTPDDRTHWVMRPLGLLRRADAEPDHPLNTWLIEAANPTSGVCLLYRPQHEQPLLEYDDRLALLVAIGTPGALQDDLLQRLPAPDRKVYAHGGFQEPHLFHPLDDSFAVPFATPAPVTLSTEPAVDDIGKAIYQASIEETIQHFQAHAVTTHEATWKSRITFGWLLFNSVLPFAGRLAGRLAWLAQIETALAQVIDTDDSLSPTEHRIAWVNLLLNLALLLLSGSPAQLQLEEGAEDHLAPPPLPSPQAPALAQVETTVPDSELDFSWAQPAGKLSQAQRQALNALSSRTLPQSLGEPIPHGALAGLHLHDNNLYVLLEGKAYSVLLDEPSGQPRIVGDSPEQLPGPWLRRDEANRWGIDLRLRLRGGMPMTSRIARLREANRQALVELDRTLAQDLEQGLEQLRRMRIDASSFNDDMPEDDLRKHLHTCQAASLHWKAYLERLNQRNALEVRDGFKLERANALTQRAFSEQMIYATLHQLYTPKRTQLMRFISENETRMSPADLVIYSRRLAEISPLLDELVINADAMHDIHAQLKKLTNRGQDRIQAMFDSLERGWPSAERPITCRYIRLENHFNRLFAFHPLKASEPRNGGFWLKLANDNISLVIAQRRQLAALAKPSDELATRLLKSAKEWLAQADRQLGNFKTLSTDTASTALLAPIEQDLAYIQATVSSELAEYPDYPPTTTLSRLREQTPGLIETEEHGVLLGVPRAGDETTVDIEAPGPEGRTRTYRQDHGNWVEVPPAPVARARTNDSLKRLLKGSQALMDNARATLHHLQGSPNERYLPVEIHDELMLHGQRMTERADAIERRLTADNASDEASGGQDAARVGKALSDLAMILESQAKALRIQAALSQKPRMGELQNLIDNHEVTVHALGARTRLAKVKGRPADYLDEYVIRHQGRDLWYAHFHYPAQDTAKPQFLAGHLKTADQRHLKGQTAVDVATGRPVEVYRSPITLAAATRFFFSL